MSDNAVAAEEKGNMGFIVLICLVATLGGFLFGFDSGVINGTVKGLDAAFGATNFASGLNVASMLLGCAVGAFSAGWLSDRFGRRNMMMLAAVFFLISAWGSGIADSSGVFIFFRILGGLAVGAASVMAPAYISEIAPARMRGGLASLQQIAIVVGLTVAFFSNYYLAGVSGGATAEFRGTETWRWMFWVEIAPAALFFILLFFIPKSPRFSMVKDDEAGARKTLTKLFGGTVALPKLTRLSRMSLWALAYVFFFNMTWGPVMWVLLGEMFPNQIRGSALAVAGFAQWIANFVVTLTFPLMLANIGLSASFFIYSAFAFISIFFVAKFVRETKGMELEDMVG